MDNQPPLIKSTDYDPDIFDPTLLESNEVTSSTRATGFSLFADLVRVQGEVLERLRGSAPRNGTEAILRILDLENQLDQLRSRLAWKTLGPHHTDNSGEIDGSIYRADVAGRLLRQIHFNW